MVVKDKLYRIIVCGKIKSIKIVNCCNYNCGYEDYLNKSVILS